MSKVLVSMYDGPEQIEKFNKMTKKANVPEDIIILRDRWYDKYNDFGVKLTNRAGTISVGDQEKIDPKKLGDQVVKVLKTVYDPEIPVDIYELGLIYDVFLNESNDVKVLMTLTTPNCPVADSLPEEVKNKIKEIPQVNEVEIEMTFDPPWSKDLMSEEAKLELGFL